MTEFFWSILRVLLALGIVIVLIFLTLPYILPIMQRLKGRMGEEGSNVKLKRIIPLGRNMLLVELEVRGKLILVAITEGAVEVIYKDEVDSS